MRGGETTLRHLLAPIEHVLSARDVNEIVIQRPGEVGVERRGEWQWLEVPQYDFRHLDALGILAAKMMAKTFDRAHPIALSTLPGGQRFTMAGPPVTDVDEVAIAIRVPSDDTHTVHDDDFIELLRGTATHADIGTRSADDDLVELYDAARSSQDEAADGRARVWSKFFDLAIKRGKMIGTIGEVGSGKTWQLKRFAQSIPSHLRVVTAEDTKEFGAFPVRNRVSLFYGSAVVTADDLVELMLRLRPDIPVFQELRGREAFGFMRLLVSGHKGGLTSWHADESDPFSPLVLMCKQHPFARDIEDAKIEAILRRLIDIIVFCRRDKESKKFSIPSVYFRAAAERRLMS